MKTKQNLKVTNLSEGRNLNPFAEDIFPVSRGGKSTWGNTICACPACNQRKGNRTPHEANMKLLWEPNPPPCQLLGRFGRYSRQLENLLANLPKNLI